MMRRATFAVSVVIAFCFAPQIRAEEPKTEAAKAQHEPTKEEKLLEGLEPVMVDISDRERPSPEEWKSLNEDGTRGGMLGSIADFRSKTIAFMNTRYFTANPAEGTLASYGKMNADKQYDRYGHIAGVEFSMEQNSWKQHHVLNAAALFQLAGSRFLEFAGVTLEAAVKDKRQIDVTFIGTNVPKDEAIRRLNRDPAALEYLGTLDQKVAAFDKQPKKPFGNETPPPAPKVILANVVMLNGNFSSALDASVDGKLHSRIIDDGVELKVTKQNGEDITLLSPVVRCYRTYTIEFKKDANGGLVVYELVDSKGQHYRVPQVFDLTPDI